jgi:hypothetical protein
MLPNLYYLHFQENLHNLQKNSHYLKAELPNNNTMIYLVSISLQGHAVV